MTRIFILCLEFVLALQQVKIDKDNNIVSLSLLVILQLKNYTRNNIFIPLGSVFLEIGTCVVVTSTMVVIQRFFTNIPLWWAFVYTLIHLQFDALCIMYAHHTIPLFTFVTHSRTPQIIQWPCTPIVQFHLS